jgi:hypothetical protein
MKLFDSNDPALNATMFIMGFALSVSLGDSAILFRL